VQQQGNQHAIGPYISKYAEKCERALKISDWKCITFGSTNADYRPDLNKYGVKI
jgi:hypothetical protein